MRSEFGNPGCARGQPSQLPGRQCQLCLPYRLVRDGLGRPDSNALAAPATARSAPRRASRGWQATQELL